MASTLEIVPAEVQLLLLRHLDSIETLFDLLRASPALLRVYQTNRNTIYPSIVYNQITPDFVPIAIITLRLREISPTIRRTASVRALRYATTHLRLSMTDWKRMFRFQRIIDEMVQHTVKKAFQLLRADVVSVDSLHTELSSSERYRMVRAFYKRELYISISKRYLSAARASLLYAEDAEDDDENTEDFTDAEDYLHSLGCCLSTWTFYEFEEVSFIEHHLRERLDQLRNQVGHDSFENPSVQTNWLGNILYGEDLAAIHRLITAPSSITRIDHLLWRDLDTERYRMQIDMQLIVHRAISASKLSSPLLSHDRTIRSMAPLDWNSCQFDESTNGPSFGLLWGCRTPDKISPDTFPNLGLADRIVPWGAAIWDSARLKKMGILGNHPGHIACDSNDTKGMKITKG